MQAIGFNKRHGVMGATSSTQARAAMLAAMLLVFAVLPTASAQEIEPNDTFATATPLDLNGVGDVTVIIATLGNGFSPDRDVDMYSFEIDANAPLPVRVTADLASVTPGLDAYLRFFDASHVELVNNDDRDFDDVDPRLQTFLFEPGLYYVGVSAANNPHYGDSAGICGWGRGDCCAGNGTPGCYDEACCNQVCESDPSCCNVEWNDQCAESAVAACSLCGVPVCGDNIRQDDESCDGTDDAVCPGQCQPDCTCPPGTGGTYALALATKAVDVPVSPFEPNDRVGASSLMGSESFVVTGEFIGDGEHARRDVDVYMLHLTRAARIDVRVGVESIGSPLEPVVRIRTCTDGIDIRTQADECSIGSSNDVSNGSPDALTSAGVLESQDIYILVSGVGNRRFDPATSGSGEMGSVGPYDIDVSVTYFDIAAPGEPNDSILMATRLVPFAPGRPDIIEVEAFLGDGRFAPFQGDRDFYEVTLVDDTRLLSIDVTPLEGSALDPVVVVYDRSGSRIASDDNAGFGLSASLVLPTACVPVAEDAKSVFVTVMGTGQRPPPDPFLPFPDATTIDPDAMGDGPGSTGAYRMTVEASPVTDACANEPDDVLATATETGIVDVGMYVCSGGEIGDGACSSPEQDVDIWSLDVTRPPLLLKASLATCRPDAITRFSIRLFDESGAQRASLNVPDSLEDSPTLTATLEQPGRYFVVVSGLLGASDFDPTVACSSFVGGLGSYDLILRVGHGPDGPGLGRSARQGVNNSGQSSILATPLGPGPTRIDAVDAATGATLSSFAAPESWSGGAEGLAYDGANLFYLGVGFYPRLYRLEPTSGEVLDELILWFGSGFFSDAVMLGGELFLLDYRNRSVHVIDPIGRRLLRTLHVGHLNGITISGGLAALSAPNKLFVADAFNTRNVYEIDPAVGVLTGTLSPPPSAPRPIALAGSGNSTLFVADWQSNVVARMDRAGNDLGDLSLGGAVGALAGDAGSALFGDFDFDGDVDLRDFARYQSCLADPGGASISECVPGNRNGDQDIDLVDYAAFPASMTGP